MSDTSLLASRQIALIGRDKLIQTILKTSKANRAALILLQGEGGIGKTTILRATQEHAKGICFCHILDLYHLEYQTPEGFAWAVQELLPEIDFNAFRDNYHHMQQALDTHDNDTANQIWQKAEKSWVEAINTRLRHSPIWILLDTIEVLPVPKAGEEPYQLLSWLVQILRYITGPLIIVAAGRPSAACDYLWQHIPKHYKKWKPSMRYLSEEESRLYLQKTIELIQPHDPTGTQRLRDYLQQWGITSLYHQTRGKPLRLAIVADILRTGSNLPEAFYCHPVGKPVSSESLDRSLVQYLSQLASPLGEIIQTMAFLRKGVDVRLLSKVMEIPEEEAEKYLKQAETLTLVKQRPGENIPRSYFLHDEIYELFSRYHPLDKSARQALFQRLDNYYQEEISHWRNELKKFSPLRSRYLKRWRLAQIERMYYALWMNGLQGYSDYFILKTDLNVAGDISTLNLVRSELRVARKLCTGMESSLLEKYLEYDPLFRKVEELMSQRDLTSAEKILQEIDPDTLPIFLQAYLFYLLALIGIRKGQQSMRTARLQLPILTLLNKSLDKAKSISEPKLENAKQALLSYIDNYLGYQYRREGKYQKAHRYYQESAARMRRLGLTGVDGVLVNQAYAMSMLGFDRRAYETARESAEIAQQSNDIKGQIRALNVMAFVLLRTGHPERAKTFIEKVFKLLPHLPNASRLKGIALINKAIAERMTWNQIVADNLVDWKLEWAKILPYALYALEGKSTHIQQKLGLKPTTIEEEAENGAITLLKKQDAENLVIAQNESGSCWREIARALHGFSERNTNKQRVYETCTQMARTRYLQAIGITDERRVKPEEKFAKWRQQINEQIKRIGGSPYWPTSALVNLAWHEYYQNDDSNLEFYTALVRDTIGKSYQWPPQVSPENAEIQRWVVLGKLEMLHCFYTLRQWESDPKPEKIHQAMYHAALSLEYNYHIGQTSYDLRRAEISLETRLRSTRDWETRLLPYFYSAAQSIQAQFSHQLPPGKLPRLLHWLNERFGNYELWR